MTSIYSVCSYHSTSNNEVLMNTSDMQEKCVIKTVLGTKIYLRLQNGYWQIWFWKMRIITPWSLQMTLPSKYYVIKVSKHMPCVSTESSVWTFCSFISNSCEPAVKFKKSVSATRTYGSFPEYILTMVFLSNWKHFSHSNLLLTVFVQTAMCCSV